MKKSNVHYLTTTLAAASLLASSTSYSLGVGDMKLQSALNQNLQAEINLILSDGESPNDFKVNLAPNAKFDEAGIPWTLFLAKIKFQIVTQNAKTLIKLSSNEALKEPFLDFLIEVKNSKGSVYREFTVLIDPPPVYQNLAVPSAKQTADEPQHFVTDPTSQTFDATVYGPTRENETLWSIAMLFNKQNAVSVHRMVAAIFSANADAFLANETHALIPGKMLKIPSFTESPELFIASVGQEISHPPRAKKTVTVNKAKVVDSVVNPLASSNIKPASPENAKTVTENFSNNPKQKLVELEKQLAVMQKAVADKVIQMEALKVAEKEDPVISTPSVIVPPVPMTLPAKVAQPIVVIPPPNLPTTVVLPPVISTPAPVAIAPVTPPTVGENYFGISADLYYYGVVGMGSLLLAVLGWLRLRERNKTKKNPQQNVSEISTITEPKKDDGDEVMNENSVFTDSTDVMFGNDFDMEHRAFEESALSEFDEILVKNSAANSIDDVMYKVDVYCSYGSNEQAKKLLHDEFFNRTDMHSYALRLLKLYQSEENKTEFKNFVFELVKLGKKDLPDFWSQVSDIAAEFYPEALFFMPPPAIPDENATSTNEMITSLNSKIKFDDDLDFDSMSFDDVDDKEITFGEELTIQETQTSYALDDIFVAPETTLIATDETVLEFSGFTLSDSLKPAEMEFELSEKEETALDFRFDNFLLSESLEPATLEFTKPAEVKLELEFDLSHFTLPESLEPETLEFTKPAEVELELEFDLSHFTLPESLEPATLEFTKPAEVEPELEFDLSHFTLPESLDPTPLEFTQPVEVEPELEFDLSHFTLPESKNEYEMEESDLDFAIKNFTFGEPIIKEPEETVLLSEKSFAQPETLNVNRPFDFDTVNALVEEKINQTYLELAKVHATEGVHIDYLDMSDSQFADSLAAEVLKKCQIREQLCRQKITQEVLSKLC